MQLKFSCTPRSAWHRQMTLKIFMFLPSIYSSYFQDRFEAQRVKIIIKWPWRCISMVVFLSDIHSRHLFSVTEKPCLPLGVNLM